MKGRNKNRSDSLEEAKRETDHTLLCSLFERAHK